MCANLMLPIKSGYTAITSSSRHGAKVAERAATMQSAKPVRKNIAKGKGYVTGAFTPIIEGVTNLSDSLGVALKTLGKIGRNVRKTKFNNPDKSKIQSTIKGIKETAPQIKDAAKEIIGVKDVVEATKAGGTVRGVIEAGKATARVSMTLGAFVAGNLIPVPGASVVGWVGAEKLINTLLGKPFTKQAKNLAK